MTRIVAAAPSLLATHATETPEGPAPEARSFAGQTALERLSRVPAHTPEWTNLNDSDPGVPLVETFAWLGDATGYLSALGGGAKTQDDVDQGRLVGEVGVATLKPAEFVILRFSHKMGDDD